MAFHDENDLNDLKRAKRLLESPGVAARITNVLGIPIEKGFDLLPSNWNVKISEITQAALSKAANAAVFTMSDAPGGEASNLLHKIAVATTGGIGGFFGLPALAVELPISTTIMLRSIADVARSEGESINSIDAKMACIEVFALGGASKSDDASESGYSAEESVSLGVMLCVRQEPSLSWTISAARSRQHIPLHCPPAHSARHANTRSPCGGNLHDFWNIRNLS